MINKNLKPVAIEMYSQNPPTIAPNRLYANTPETSFASLKDTANIMPAKRSGRDKTGR